ncbi:MAG: profilin, required for normal timing of actin polymerization in response to thermal stress [Chrysothrix sp. TS-e1954]|nr:MAG: profilin, required for normal timing of actin polymerization in response to thermal stress [Chrysothrix sp. TS-e1954]
MSWQAYVDDRLIGSQQLNKAAIFDVQGTSVWAASPGFSRDRQDDLLAAIGHGSRAADSHEVTPDELKSIVAAFNDKGDKNGVKKVQSEGIHVAGERYVVLKAEDRSLYGKKGKEGIVIVKTTQAMLIGHHPDNVQTPNAATVVEQLADYLVSVGY